MLTLFALQAHCQSPDSGNGVARPQQGNSATAAPGLLPADTSKSISSDSLFWPKDDSDLSTTILYTAEDSMVMDVPNRKVLLYGKAKVEYGDISLTAAKISVDWTNNEMRAMGVVDSNGKYTGRPYFKQGEDEYVSDSMAYNINSEKGIIYNIVTEQNGGYVTGSPVKRTKDAVYIKTGTYTTCNLGEPHFHIQAHKLKIIPEREIISGPFHMVISGIHTPIGFPLGFFPIIDKGKSGVIFPTIGDSRQRGFFISRGGYYFKVKESMGVSLIGDYYSNGSFLLTMDNVYKNRYDYDGRFTLNYGRTRDGYGSALDSINPYTYNYNVRWVHATSGNKNYRFSSDVNMVSSSFYSKNSYDPSRVQSNTFQSTVSYYKSLRNTPFNFTISANQYQNVQTKEMRVTLPNISLNMNRVYPFRKKVGSGKGWYEQIVFQVTGNSSYSFSNKFHDYETGKDSIYEFNEDNYEKILQNGTPGAKWDIPVSATFNVLKYFNFTPSVNYSEYWYTKRLNYTLNPADSVVSTDYEEGFFRTSQYNAQIRMNTWIYGKWTNRGKGALRGVLHSINPIFGYTYKPDFSKNDQNYQTFDEKIDYNGNKILYNRYAAAPYGGPAAGTQNIFSFEIRNIVEAKYKSRKDTVNANGKKIKLLENLSLSSNYDFTKEAFKLNYFLLNARTRIALFDINFNSTFDPYIYVVDTTGLRKEGVRVNRYAYAEGQGLANLKSLNFSVSRTFSPKKMQGQQSTTDRLSNIKTAEAQSLLKDPNSYVDFTMPWGLTLTYMYGYSKNGLAESIINQSIKVSGNINLTQKWKFSCETSYDFILKGPGATSLILTRDLHCWQASFNCIPFGPRQAYFFTFSAKSTLLQDLKLSKKSPGYFGQYY